MEQASIANICKAGIPLPNGLGDPRVGWKIGCQIGQEENMLRVKNDGQRWSVVVWHVRFRQAIEGKFSLLLRNSA